jgi:hypothetical protein
MVKETKTNTNANTNTSSVFSSVFSGAGFLNHHIMYLNNSKFFAGIIMILLNIGSKFITIQFSKSTEEYMKMSVCKEILVFAMAWMGTRDIYVALGLTAIFSILSDHLFNEESSLCIVPEKYRILDKIVDTNGDGEVSETELSNAIAILEKAKKDRVRKEQQGAFMRFNFEKYDFDNVDPNVTN